PLARNRPDHGLTAAVVSDQLPDGVDAVANGRLRNVPALPDRVDEFIDGDEPVTVANQMKEEVEDLWLGVHDFASTTHLAQRGIDNIVDERKLHRRLLSRPLCRTSRQEINAAWRKTGRAANNFACAMGHSSSRR